MQQRSRGTPGSLPDLPSPRMRGSAYAGSTQYPQATERRAYSDQAPAMRRPVSQPVLRAQPTAETVDALRSVLDDLHSTVVAESEAERHVQEEEPADEAESMDSAVAMLLEQLEAAEERAAYAEQQAIYAGQQAAQQLAAQASALPQPAIAHGEPEVSTRASSFAAWGGWCAAVLATALAAGTYFTSYRPLHEQLAAQTKLIELQALRSSETEAALRRSFDREREALNEQLNTLRETAAVAATASSAPVAADAPTAHQPAADSGEHAATTKAGKLEARAAKRAAWLAKKAERAAKREARATKHKAHAAASAHDDESDKSQASKPKHKAKPAADNTAEESDGNDPLEGL
jgi:hypothetical protein